MRLHHNILTSKTQVLTPIEAIFFFIVRICVSTIDYVMRAFSSFDTPNCFPFFLFFFFLTFIRLFCEGIWIPPTTLSPFVVLSSNPLLARPFSHAHGESPLDLNVYLSTHALHFFIDSCCNWRSMVLGWWDMCNWRCNWRVPVTFRRHSIILLSSRPYIASISSYSSQQQAYP